MAEAPRRPRVLVVDDDAVSRAVLGSALRQASLDCTIVADGASALAEATAAPPDAILLDLMMPDMDGWAVLERLRADPTTHAVPVVVLTALETDDDIERVFLAGADDYVKKPFRAAELVARLRGQLRLRSYVADLGRRERDAQSLLELTHTLSSGRDIREVLLEVARRVALATDVERCSVVLGDEAVTRGFVVASSDDGALRDLELELSRYPELTCALQAGEPLLVRDAATEPLLADVVRRHGALPFASLAVLPMRYGERARGALFLRSKRKDGIDEGAFALARAAAGATAVALRNARIVQSLRDETRVSADARREAERRVQLFQRYADFFESAADGMVVMDGSGNVLLMNPRARELLALDERGLSRTVIGKLLVEEDRQRAEALLRGFKDRVYPHAVDLRIRDGRDRLLTLSVSFSSVLHEDDAVLFTFRDVTRERQIAVELEKTKDFLERVIDSSVDGIVSADLDGRVLLFNRAAARMFGYSPEEVVGKLSVEKLYPPGMAREVMRKIRDPELHGPGRLEDYRVDMQGRHGEPIQVTLSAALILEHGVPIGSVGIFTDIRERLRMEARLTRAQEELRVRERQSIVAELAGAAAHELNQPLTSVIGYAELLRRQLADSATLAHAASVIVSEAERMAEIVRKVGKITRYETKSYVGEARILDLDKASEEPQSSRRPR